MEESLSSGSRIRLSSCVSNQSLPFVPTCWRLKSSCLRRSLAVEGLVWSYVIVIDALSIQDRSVSVLHGSHDFRSLLQGSLIQVASYSWALESENAPIHYSICKSLSA